MILIKIYIYTTAKVVQCDLTDLIVKVYNALSKINISMLRFCIIFSVVITSKEINVRFLTSHSQHGQEVGPTLWSRLK